MNGFNLNEEDLLKQFGQAKQKEIERLLSQYGGSLKEVREMYPQLTTAIEKRRLLTTLQTQPFFFTSGEAAEMGLRLQEGWMLKMSPFNGGYKSSLVTPEKWELTEDENYISPSGEQFTRLELETALGMGQVPSMGELGEPSLQLQQIFGGVFPEKDIAEVLAYAESDPEAFLQDILEIGRTPETESLLRTMYEGVTEEWLTDLFQPLELRQTLMEALPVVKPNNIDLMLEHFGANPEALRAALIYAGRNEDTERLVRMLFPEATEQQISDYFNPMSLVVEAKAAEGGQGVWGTFTAGVGDLVANVGGAFKWCGAEGVGDKIIKFGQYLQVQAEPVPFEPDEFTWGQLFNPQFYATYGVRMLPTLMVLAIPGIGAYGLAGNIAAKVGLGAVGRAIITGIGGAILSRPLESALEAGGAYDLARQKGLSHEEAEEAADEVFKKNLALGGLDAVQIAVAFMPFGGIGKAATGAVTRGLVKTGQIAGKLVFTGLTEGGEELYQEMVQKRAMGEEVDLSDPDMQLVFSLGALAGLGMGGGADIITRITNRGAGQLTPEQKEVFDKSKADFIAQGLTEDIATQKALDTVIEQHPEVADIIERATREVEIEVTNEQAQGLARVEAEDKPRPAMPSEERPLAETTMPVGEGLGMGVKDVAAVFPQDQDLDAELEIPDSKAIIDGLIVPNWIKTTLTTAAKVPVLRRIHEAVLGWRSLVDKRSQVTEDIVGRAAVAYGAIRRMGIDVARVRITALKNTIPNPVKYFEFNDVGYSEKMAARLLPDYESERANAGTMEHVFTQPEMYSWTGMDAGLVYVARVNQINAAMLSLLQKEGVALNAVSERWIHRVVTGRTIEGEVIEARGRPGRTGAKPGAVPSYKKPRTFKTMAEGIAALVEYEPNIEVSVSSYIEEAYKEIAGARFTKLVEEFGITPSERLLERYPELFVEAELTPGAKAPVGWVQSETGQWYKPKSLISQEELADAAYLESVIKRAKRGEKLPGQTLLAIQRRFPEIGKRLRALVEQGGVAEKQMRQLLKQNDRLISDLKAQLARAKVAVKPAEVRVEVTRIETADIEPHVETKYSNLPGEESEAVAKHTPLELLEDKELTPEQIEGALSKLKAEDATTEIEAIEAAIGDLQGDLIETYRYESWEDGQNLERYLDSLLEVTQKHRKALGMPQIVDLTIEPLTGKPKRVAKPEPVVIPDEQKLREAFKLMDYEDKLAFRETMGSQLQDLGQMLEEQGAQLEALTETFESDRARPFIDIVAKTGEYKGEIAYLTVNQYRLLTGAKWVFQTMEKMGRKVKTKVLLGGKMPNPSIMTPDGKKVRWEYAMDEVAQELGYENDEALKKAIEAALDMKQTIGDLKVMLSAGEERLDGVKRMLSVLTDVESIPAVVEAEVVEPVPEVVPSAKEPWQMTSLEYDRYVLETRYFTPAPGSHEQYVIEALKQGKPVPAEVLADYPDLAKAIPEAEAVPEDLQDQISALETALMKSGKDITAIQAEASGLTDAQYLARLREIVAPEAETRRFISLTKSTDPTQKRAPWRVAYEYKGEEHAYHESSKAKAIERAKSALGVEIDPETLQAKEVREEAAPYVPMHGAMTIDQFKETLDRVAAETEEELKGTKEWLTEQRQLRKVKAISPQALVADDRLFAEEQARADVLKDILPTFREMQKNPEGYYPRLETEFPNIYDLLLDRGRELRIIPSIRKAVPGMPEAGLQVDMFGYQTPVQPKGKGQTTQISMDDYKNLVKRYEEEGLPMPYMRVKPKIEGISELSGDTEFQQEVFPVAEEKSRDQRITEFDKLSAEAKALVEARKAPYWQARAERAAAMAIVSQPGIGEGYLPMPFAGGKIYNQDFIDSCNKFFGVEKGSPFLKFTSDAASILRITKAALDFSFHMLQGLPSFGLSHAYLMINPRIGSKLMGAWYKALGFSVAGFFHPSTFYGHMAKNEKAALQRVSFGGSSRAIDYFEALKGKHGLGRIASWTLSKLPLDPFGRAELAFYSAGEIVRNEFWKILSDKAIQQGKAFELARSLDLMTGLTQTEAMGVPLTIRQLESSFLWFAPNYTRACLTVLADIFRGGYTGAKAKQALGGMMVAGVVYYVGIQLAMALLSGKSMDDAWDDVEGGLGIREDPITHEVTWRPLSDFMAIKVENYTFGVGSFWYGFVRLVGNIVECINEVGNKERIDLVTILKHGAPNRDNPFVYWWYTRASPLTGLGFELATHKDFLSYPIETPGEYAKYILTRFEPIWMEQGINWMIPGAARDYEIPEGAAKAAIIPFELFGWRSVPESTWSRFYDGAGEYIKQIPRDELDPKQIEAWESGKLGWAQLTRKQKQDLIKRYPELAGLYEEAMNDSRIRQSPEWEAYTERIDEERGIYHDRIDDLTARLQGGEIDTRIYRELASEAGMNYGSIIEAISRDETYAEIFAYFDKKEAEGSPYEFTFDLAYAEYNSQIRFADDPDIYLANGDYNWDERDRRIDDFIAKHGEDLYSAILDYISGKKEEKGLNPVWIRRGQDTEKLGRSYWRLPYKPIMDMTEEDYDEGNIPAEYYGVWKTYQALSDEDKEGFLSLHPELAKDWRAEYRKSNPEADAMLALWGYSGKLQSMEAYNLVKQWGDEMGIPLSQMGLGLPTESLMPSYFDYAGLLTEHSAASPQVKLWRLQHPDFNNWAMENWGWQGTEDYKGIEYYKLQVKWQDKDIEYNAIEGDIARRQFLQANPDYWTARLKMRAMDYEFPEDLMPDYVEWYQSEAGFENYEDDWWLMEHKDFYDTMYDLDIWTEPRDFATVPTREVWNLYQAYLKLPTGTPRLDFRAKYPQLDGWLVLKFGYKPIEDRGNTESATPWEELAEAEKFKELFK